MSVRRLALMIIPLFPSAPSPSRDPTSNRLAGAISSDRASTSIRLSCSGEPFPFLAGKIRLHIMPEFGVVVGTVQVATSTVPIVDTRKVDTTALVDDGEAVVLGGLRKKDTTRQVNKVPLLGDLPIIGNFFKFTGETTTVAELVVFITPRIITDSVLTEDEQMALDSTDFEVPKPGSTRAEKKATE